MRSEFQKNNMASKKRNRRLPGPTSARRAAIVLELLLALPLFVIALLAVIEFGVLYANLQQLAFACRVGALEASQTANLPNENPGVPVPANIEEAITNQLSLSGIRPCAIILEHNTNMGGMEQTLRTDFDNDNDSNNDCPSCSEPSSAIPANSVRVTICVQMGELAPNVLRTFGLDIDALTTHCATTYGYELP